LRPASLAVLAAVLLLAACGSRQREVPPWLRPAQPPRDENYHGGPVAMLLRHDANHDGVLARSEMVAGLKADFAAADTRHTGCLDESQAAAINQQRIDADQSTATPLIDWNHDGCINYTEFSAAPYSLFDQLDRNNDGKLTSQEMGQKKDKPKARDDSGAEPDGQGAPSPEGHRRGRRGGRMPGGEIPGGPPGGDPLPAVPD
jgi:hypothetical protein